MVSQLQCQALKLHTSYSTRRPSDEAVGRSASSKLDTLFKVRTRVVRELVTIRPLVYEISTVTLEAQPQSSNFTRLAMFIMTT